MRILLTVIFSAIVLGCASKSGTDRNVLPAPLGTKPDAAAQVEKGNTLFASRPRTSGADWRSLRGRFSWTELGVTCHVRARTDCHRAVRSSHK